MKTIEQKYKKLTDIEHVLLRPGMYVGSTKLHADTVFLPDESGKYVATEISYNPAFLKIFDEILSNSADEHKRNPKLNKIDVKIDPVTGKITVWDNGGIPVKKHGEYNEWIPELIFSNLKAGSNFDDSEERLVAGTNGVGSTLTNIYSKEFTILTCDGSNIFTQTFSNNMQERTEALVLPSDKKGFTEISFLPDYEKFNLDLIDESHLRLLQKRCVDIAACNPKLQVSFNGTTYKFPRFYEYCQLYANDIIFEASERWQIGITASVGSFQQVSFVNGVETKDGGTHVDFIVNQIVEWLRSKIKKKYKLETKPSDIKNQIKVFVQAEIVNPAFSSQTKEKLITETRDFGSAHEIADKTFKALFESEVVKQILDWAQQKALADERKQLRELNKSVEKGKVLKLIDAKARGDRSHCTLALFEGDSASSAFRKYRDPMSQGAFPLRGKFINVTETPIAKVVQNQEVRDLLTAVSLKLGEPPGELRYGKILIYADADPDGDSIAGLLINFFGRYWPELFDSGSICRVMTPLVVAKKGSDKRWFYTPEEFDEWQKKTDTKKWSIEYKKGLAALEDDEYREIIVNPNLFTVKRGDSMKDTLDTWFGESFVDKRKEKILAEPVDE